MHDKSVFSFIDSFNFAIPAGGTLNLPVVGSFVYVDSLSVNADVVLEGESARVPLKNGRRIEFSREMRGGLRMLNRGAASASGVLLVGEGDIRDASVTGEVAVTNFPASPPLVEDSGGYISKNRDAYLSYAAVGGVAGKFGTHQFFNPDASGKNVYIEMVSAEVRQAQETYLREYDIESALAVQTPWPMRRGGPAASVVYRAGAADSQLGTAVTMLFQPGSNAGVAWSAWQHYHKPLVLPPGRGVLFVATAANTACNLQCRFYEVDI